MKRIIFFILLLLYPAYAHGLIIMSWNLEDMDVFDGQGVERVPKQLKIEQGIAAVVRRINPDIFLILEAPSLVELQSFVLSNNLPYQIAHQRQQHGNRSFADGFGLLVKNGLKLGTVELLTPEISNGRPYNDWSMRGLLVAQVGDITVIGVHLKSPMKEPEEALQKQRQQAEALKKYVLTIPGKWIIAGDFNNNPVIDELETKYGMPDTMALFSEFNCAFGNEATHKKGFNIDHFIGSKKLKISVKHIEKVPWLLSDHRPIWIEATP